MRFGLNTFLVSPGFTSADLDMIRLFKSYGADVIELALVDPEAVNVASLRGALEKAELERPFICGAFGPGRDLRGSPEEVKQSSDYINELIDIAVALDSKIVCGQK